MTGSDDTVRKAFWKALNLDRYYNNEEVNKGYGTEDKSSYNCGAMAYKIFKNELWGKICCKLCR